MKDSHTRLEYWRDLAQLVSAIVMPLILAVIAYYVQKALAEPGLRKDYVQIAISILKEEPTKQNSELREWAISILDSNSPVALPAGYKKLLFSSKLSEVWRPLGPEDKFNVIRSLQTECRDAPDEATLKWLIENYPDSFIRCDDGKLGHRKQQGVQYILTPPNKDE